MQVALTCTKPLNPTILEFPTRSANLFDNTPTGLPGFQWAADGDVPVGQTPWDALDVDATGTENDPIPVIIDQNTAMWSLQMMKGVGEVRAFEYEPGKLTYFRVVGLLANSLLQGKLMIGENNFKRIFPDISGYQYFLIAVDDSRSNEVAGIFENRLGDIGMDITDANRTLATMLAVQNTYLRTFQSLGALGLLLGTIGLAVAQMRSVLERRQEWRHASHWFQSTKFDFGSHGGNSDSVIVRDWMWSDLCGFGSVASRSYQWPETTNP